MKLLFFFFLFISCIPARPNLEFSNQILIALSENQKLSLNKSALPKEDFLPIILFGSKGRISLYSKNSFDLKRYKEIIILEGFQSSTGLYIGLIYADGEKIYYEKISTNEWLFIAKDESKAFKHKFPDSVEIKVTNWDTTFINGLRNKVGSTVTDGFNFVASKITIDYNNTPEIRTMIFYEFSPLISE